VSVATRAAQDGVPRAWEFAAGALLALAAARIARLPPAVATSCGVAGAGLVAASAFGIHQTGFPGTHALIPVAAAVFLVAAGTAPSHGVSWLLATRPAAWIGDRSYSWYLWHWPVIVFATSQWPNRRGVGTLDAAVSLIPAWASYRFVENPIRFSRLTGLRPVALTASLCVAVPVAGAAVLMRSHDTLIASRGGVFTEWSRSQQQHADAVRGCDSSVPLDERRGGRCLWTVARPKGTIVLVGDSNAGHFTEPVTRAANANGYDALVVTSSGCPFVDVEITNLAMSPDVCRTFRHQTLRDLVRMHPSLVIMAARTDGVVESTQAGILDPADGRWSRDPAEKARLWRDGLVRVLRPLTASGVPVILVHPVPAIPDLPTACTTAAILSGNCTGSVRAPPPSPAAVAPWRQRMPRWRR